MDCKSVQLPPKQSFWHTKTSQWLSQRPLHYSVYHRSLAVQPFQISLTHFPKELCELSFGWRSGKWTLGELQVIMVPRCKHLLALFVQPSNSSWPPLSHREVQLLYRTPPATITPLIHLCVSVFKESRQKQPAWAKVHYLFPHQSSLHPRGRDKCFHQCVHVCVLGIHLE